MKKQIYLTIALSGVLLLLSSTFNSCIQEGTFSKATIETNQVTSVTEATAICGGVISGDGGSNITARGVCWSTSPNPTIENDTTIDAAGTGSFTSLIKGLSPSTTYYVRAYAVNKGGTGYGLQMTFTTKTFSITTTPIDISSVTATSAIGGGNIIYDGESSTLTVKARGVCWNTFPSPTIENSKTVDGVGGGGFTSMIDSLKAFTTYYVRAYATNGNGTIYGNEVSFTTLSGIIGITTKAISSITAFIASSGGTITTDGGAYITARGVCWNTSSTPTIANNKTIEYTVLGSFPSMITGLSANTLYYVRSYATNSIGTSYGNEVSFTTTNIVTDIAGNVYSFVKIGTQVWMVENLKTTKYNDGTSIPNITDGTTWKNITTPGYCFYNNDAANKSTHGALYNWYTVNTGKLAPTGWHVPIEAEWTKLKNDLNSIDYDYYFAGIPGGYRSSGGTFYEISVTGLWWSSTQGSASYAWGRNLYDGYSSVGNYSYGKQYGFSVRCVRD